LFPRPVPGGPVRRPRRRRSVGRLLLAAALFATLAAVTGPPVDYVFLALGTCALAAAGVVSVLLQWAATVPAPPGAGPVDPAEAAALLAERLRGLRRRQLADVDRALDAGRPDLARELSDRYTDEALLILTGS
jgi:hypothetical protein